MARKATKPKSVRGGPTKAKREEIVTAAQTAWHAIMSGTGDRWSYWQLVCPALKLCRDDAMREVGLDPRTHKTPTKNGRYNSAMTRALKAIGLHQIPRSSRKAGIEVRTSPQRDRLVARRVACEHRRERTAAGTSPCTTRKRSGWTTRSGRAGRMRGKPQRRSLLTIRFGTPWGCRTISCARTLPRYCRRDASMQSHRGCLTHGCADACDHFRRARCAEQRSVGDSDTRS